MDKYDIKIKLDKIKKCYLKHNYEGAAKIADEMDFRRLKDWTVIAMLIGIYENLERYEDVRYFAILAYNRNLGGRKNLYKLTYACIRLGQLEEAEDLYNEYVKNSPMDAKSCELLYELEAAKGTSHEELISILEDCMKFEVEEKYAYRLAYLYGTVKKYKQCIALCDEIAAKFVEGDYVDKARALKEFYLSAGQQPQQAETAQKAVKAPQEEAEQQAAVQKTPVQEPIYAEETPAKKTDTPVSDVQSHSKEQSSDKTIQSGSGDIHEKTYEEIITAPTINLGRTIAEELDMPEEIQQELTREYAETEEKVQEVQNQPVQDKKDFSEAVESARSSMAELYENAKKELDDKYAQVKHEADIETISVPVPDYSKYDTANVSAQIARSLGQVLDDMEDSDEINDVFKVTPKKTAELVEDLDELPMAHNSDEDQIEGQMDIDDFLNEAGYYEKPVQYTVPFPVTGSGTAKKQTADSQVAQELHQAQQEAAAAVSPKMTATPQASQPEPQQITETQEEKAQQTEEQPEDLSLTQPPSGNTDVAMAAVAAALADSVAAVEKAAKEEVEAQIAGETTATREMAFTEEEDEEEDVREVDMERLPEYESEEATIPMNVKRYFSKYLQVEGMQAQIGEYFESVGYEEKNGTSRVGNIIISGNKSSDKMELALNLVKAINTYDPDNAKKIARTTGDSINQRGIARAIDKLKGSALVVEQAGVLEKRRVDELLGALEGETDEMIVILLGSDAEMNALIKETPAIAEKFNHRISYKQYSVNELVEMCKRYADKMNYTIEDKALLQLYLNIDAIHATSDYVRLEQVRGVVDSAIDKAERRASHKLFGSVKKKKVDDRELVILVESDFKE